MALYDEIGGRDRLEQVHSIFYGKLLVHPWLQGFFHGKDRRFLESQQTDFISGVFGGPKIYGGRAIRCAHIHLFISEEIFAVRHNLLAQSLTEAGVAEVMARRWLDYDNSMKHALIKKYPADCKGRYKSEKPIIVPKPRQPALVS